jgi:glycine dehydrogenase subunit 1
LNEALLEEGILGGYDLGQVHPSLANCLLVTVTEMNPRQEIDLFVETLQLISSESRKEVAND